MTIRRLTLNRPDTCSVCHGELPAGTSAWWDHVIRNVTCEPCHASPDDDAASDSPTVVVQPDSPTHNSPTIERGTPGQSSLDEYKRRHGKREARIDVKFGRFAGIVKFLTDDPQSITAWAKGSEGERVLAASLAKHLGDSSVILSDRRAPRTRGNIDHLVIAPSGVWVIDAKNYSGLVEQPDVGGWFKVDRRLYVGGRDRSKALDGLTWQVEAVTTALQECRVPVSPAVCFTDAEWRLFAKPFDLRGVFVSGLNALARTPWHEELQRPRHSQVKKCWERQSIYRGPFRRRFDASKWVPSARLLAIATDLAPVTQDNW